MNEDQQDFESLRRLLALKHHEVPPPGYFNHFSRQVMARLRAGEAEESAAILARMPRLLKWLQNLETKPVFAGGFATVLCLLLLFGAILAQRPEATAQAQAFFQPASHEATPMPMVATTTPMSPDTWGQPSTIMADDNSTNPVMNFGSPGGMQEPRIQMLPFQVPGGN